MADIKARPNKITRRYGGVLLALARNNKELKNVVKDLNILRNCLEAEPVDWLRVASPSLPLYTQRRIIESLCTDLKLGKTMSHFLGVLCQHRRLPYVGLILEEFLEQAKRAEGIVDGILETPFELAGQEVTALQDSLTTQLGKKVHLQQEINESLLGGVVLRLGSLMIDGSLRTGLTKLKTAMKG